MAFQKLPKSVLDRLSKNQTALQDVLMYHAIPDATVSISFPFSFFNRKFSKLRLITDGSTDHQN